MANKLKLEIELVPASSWNSNLRSLLKPRMWEKLRKEICKKHNYQCAICNKLDKKLHIHEVWKYDDKNHIQKLVNLISLCSNCHAIKHIGLAGIQASEGKLNYEYLIKHYMKVNSCDRSVFKKHLSQALKKFEQRSQHEWSLDVLKLKELQPV